MHILQFIYIYHIWTSIAEPHPRNFTAQLSWRTVSIVSCRCHFLSLDYMKILLIYLYVAHPSIHYMKDDILGTQTHKHTHHTHDKASLSMELTFRGWFVGASKREMSRRPQEMTFYVVNPLSSPWNQKRHLTTLLSFLYLSNKRCFRIYIPQTTTKTKKNSKNQKGFSGNVCVCVSSVFYMCQDF